MAAYVLVYDSRRWVRSDSTDTTVVLPVVAGGTGTTTATGTAGSVVLSISPALTGTPTAPTAAAATNTTQIATTAFVQAALVAPGVVITVKDANFTLQDDGDITKQMKFQASGITAGQTRTLTAPDANTTLPVASFVLTYAGPTTARTITYPDANFSAARIDNSQTFAGTQSFSAVDIQHQVSNPGSTVRFINDNTATTAASSSSVLIRGGDGTTSNRLCITRYTALETATQSWDTGMNGTKTYVVRDQTAAVDRIAVDVTGNVFLRAAGTALGTTATDGFSHIPNCAGTPSGVPANTLTGATPIVYDTSANKLWSYNAGWQSASASAADIALSLLAPATDETITAGYSAVVNRSYTIALGKKLTIGSGARMRIL